MESNATLRAAFTAHLNRWMAVSFDFGTYDCVAFTVEWIDAQRGTNFDRTVAQKFRGLPFREVRVLAEQGRLQAEVLRVLGSPHPVAPKLGDVVMFRNQRGQETVGLAGETLVYGLGERGIGGLPLSTVTLVWPLEGIH